MDEFQRNIDLCKSAVLEAFPALNAEQLEYFWNGGLMEITRMLFRAKGTTDMYLVTHDELAGTFIVVKYVDESNA